ncbi:DUF1697 domain-containing protein [Deinococcus sp.]|uniref:DUF1697 domain-containing protein n=1 Tax=Deinococcus sp. TaxID=47478 RepID=UPI003C7ABCF0
MLGHSTAITAWPASARRCLFSDLGHQHVQTYIQSGNVVFPADSASVSEVALRSQAEWRGVIATRHRRRKPGGV